MLLYFQANLAFLFGVFQLSIDPPVVNFEHCVITWGTFFEVRPEELRLETLLLCFYYFLVVHDTVSYNLGVVSSSSCLSQIRYSFVKTSHSQILI